MTKSILFTIFLASFQSVFCQSTKKMEILKAITIEIPTEFNLMTDDEIAQKYPSYRKPLAVYSNPKKTADIGVNYSINKWNNKNLTILKDMYKSTINSVFTSVDFVQEGVIKKINNKDFIVFEFVSSLSEENSLQKGASIQTYSYIAYTLYEKKVIIVNFNAPALEKNNFSAVFEKTLNSVIISDKLKLPEFTPYETTRPTLPKSENDSQLKILRQMKKSKAKNPQ